MPASSDSSDPYRKASSIAGQAASAPRPPPRPGDVVGDKYRIESVIGQGGMGAVFRARHLLTERAVALKWMLPEVGGEEAVQRFLREARAMGRIDHAGVVGVLDVGLDAGATFLVMELLKGSSLRDMLEARARFEPAEAIGLLLPALEGVEAAHRNGVVHRDLKPENIFVVRAGDGTIETTKVLDFGISKLRDDRLEQSPQVDLKRGGVVTRTGVTIGTPSYMSPEQVRGAKDIDARTDVWSLGVILYELLTGEVPFRAESFGALLVAIATESYPPLDAVRPELPALLVGSVHRALEKDPSLRFADVASFAAALEPFAPKGMRFRAPDVQRLTDVSIEPPEGVEVASAPRRPSPPELAGTAPAKHVARDPLRLDAPRAEARRVEPSLDIEGRSLDVGPAKLAEARTALATALVRPPLDRAASLGDELPSLPPLELDLAPRRPREPSREPLPRSDTAVPRSDTGADTGADRPGNRRSDTRAAGADRRSDTGADRPGNWRSDTTVPRSDTGADTGAVPRSDTASSETRRWMLLGAGALVVAVVIAIVIRLVSGAMRESPTTLVTSAPTTTPLVRPTAPTTPATSPTPPPPSSLPGRTTTSGTTLTPPPPATSLELPTTPRSGREHARGTTTREPSGGPRASSTSEATREATSVAGGSAATMEAVPTPPETTGRTGSLSREEF